MTLADDLGAEVSPAYASFIAQRPDAAVRAIVPTGIGRAFCAGTTAFQETAQNLPPLKG